MSIVGWRCSLMAFVVALGLVCRALVIFVGFLFTLLKASLDFLILVLLSMRVNYVWFFDVNMLARPPAVCKSATTFMYG